MTARTTGAARPTGTTCTVVELRQYTLHPGRRDDLIDLFEREFVESQEEVGLRILGTFRDLDRPDRFVWLRGFADLASRLTGLTTFYSGPVWRAHRTAANATMIDSDDVLLLRPTPAGRPWSHPGPPPAPVPTGGTGPLVAGMVYPLPVSAGDGLRYLDDEIRPALERVFQVPVWTLCTAPVANDFPALPVREGENVYVWLAAFADDGHHEQATARLTTDPEWRDVLAPRLDGLLAGAPWTLRLRPTARSAFR
ncbi:NIPSNAP family protein [Micromonospora echinofusca]|uniref:NIPSNAP family protein n=1 Tax=Micromonospora echinofusca TaxID=47858 RepID=A0ABS3VSD3_MICEH|nr:NIPSNAP family protein [Micromonospora echinofusca]MBO4207440.1 NIPSNAP family protein [Micromonospora echinofusca]